VSAPAHITVAAIVSIEVPVLPAAAVVVAVIAVVVFAAASAISTLTVHG
jgi:hypothetical protein